VAVSSQQDGSISIITGGESSAITPFRQYREILLHSNYEETDPDKLAREVDLRPARDNALVPDQKERSDDALAV
jgi:hypothetical protein